MPTIDTHVHVISRDTAKYPLEPEIRSEWVRSHPVDAEEMLTAMPGAGVDAATLVQGNSAYKNDNSYTADAAQRFATHFIGVGIIDPLAPDAGETVRYWVRERGLKGIRLATNGAAGRFDAYHEQAFPVWEACAELGVPLTMALIPEDAAAFRLALKTFPSVKVALEHSSTARLAPETWARHRDLTALENLYAKFSTRLMNEAAARGWGSDALLQPLVQSFGASRLMWGSDYPALHDKPYAAMVQDARAAVSFLSASEQEQLMGGTAKAFWPGLP